MGRGAAGSAQPVAPLLVLSCEQAGLQCGPQASGPAVSVPSGRSARAAPGIAHDMQSPHCAPSAKAQLRDVLTPKGGPHAQARTDTTSRAKSRSGDTVRWPGFPGSCTGRVSMAPCPLLTTSCGLHTGAAPCFQIEKWGPGPLFLAVQPKLVGYL